jgi:phage tail sheath protein FI
MPEAYLYPGVYVQEIPSGVHPIAGVSTSDTAFVDFFPRGPVDEPVRITSFADFERRFGGLDRRSESSYAIQQFYLNGGSVAWVVRVAADNAQPASVDLPCQPAYSGSGVSGASGSGGGGNCLHVEAANPGNWGNNLQVAVDHNAAPDPDGLPTFNLVVREVQEVNGRLETISSETFRNLTMGLTSPRYVKTVVNNGSSLVTVDTLSLGEIPQATGSDVINGPTDSMFVWLGQGADSQAGSDGYTPDSSEWKSDQGPTAVKGNASKKTGVHALEKITPFIFNILCLPAASLMEPDGLFSVYSEAVALCEAKRAFLIIDLPASIDEKAGPDEKLSAAGDFLTDLEGQGLRHRNAALYFPRLVIPDPLNGNRPRRTAASGTLAGVYARTDSARGVWKAPAGTEASLRGADLDVKINDQENKTLNPLGVNALRNLPVFGSISWGARTLMGADKQASEWKYIPVRRLAMYIEQSLFDGLSWVVFEPNDEPLWAQIRLNVGAFMQNLFRQGAFQGKTPREAYLVKCDSETTTQADIDLGIVNIIVGFAPVKPAEFVILKIQQMAGGTQA